jgi:hypothetical protein
MTPATKIPATVLPQLTHQNPAIRQSQATTAITAIIVTDMVFVPLLLPLDG